MPEIDCFASLAMTVNFIARQLAGLITEVRGLRASLRAERGNTIAMNARRFDDGRSCRGLRSAAADAGRVKGREDGRGRRERQQRLSRPRGCGKPRIDVWLD